jgi:hypothetical protein
LNAWTNSWRITWHKSNSRALLSVMLKEWHDTIILGGCTIGSVYAYRILLFFYQHLIVNKHYEQFFLFCWNGQLLSHSMRHLLAFKSFWINTISTCSQIPVVYQ